MSCRDLRPQTVEDESCARSWRSRPSAVSRFSSHCCSRWISPHCRSQNRRCCNAEMGSRSSSEYIEDSNNTPERHARWHIACRWGRDRVVGKRTWCLWSLDPYQLEQLVRRRVPQSRIMLEDEKPPNRHLAPCGRMIELE